MCSLLKTPWIQEDTISIVNLWIDMQEMCRTYMYIIMFLEYLYFCLFAYHFLSYNIVDLIVHIAIGVNKTESCFSSLLETLLICALTIFWIWQQKDSVR